MVEYVERVDHDCRVRVRFGGPPGRIRWFVVQLEYSPAPWQGEEWHAMVRFDHQPDRSGGHDVYEEGLHVDLFLPDGSKKQLYPEHDRLPADPADVCRRCKEFLKSNYRALRGLHRRED